MAQELKLRRGIALFLVLVIVSLLAMLTLSLFCIQRGNANSFEANRHQRAAEMTARGAVALGLFRAEQDPFWARSPFTAHQPMLPQLTGLEAYEQKGTTLVEGVLPQSGGRDTFSLEVFNRLDLTPITLAAGLFVPGDSLCFRVTGRSAGFRYRAAVLYRPAPYIKASMIANKTLHLSGHQNLTLSSADPLRNQIRSNDRIWLGDFARPGSLERVTFERTVGQVRGSVWAKGDIFAGRVALRGGASMKAAQRASGALFASRSRRNEDIPPLRAEELESPQHRTARLENITLVARERKVNYSLGSNRSSGVVLEVLVTRGNRREAFFDKSGLPPSAILDSRFSSTPAVDGQVSFGEGPDGYALKFNFERRRFEIPAGLKIQASGLNIYSQLERPAPLHFLSDSQGADSIVQGTEHLRIQGPVTGRGSLFSEKGIYFQGSPKAEEDDRLIVRGKDVQVYAGPEPKIDFRGLLYADRNLRISGKHRWQYEAGRWISEARAPMESLRIEGAVVSQGSISVEDTKSAHIRYDDAVLKGLTKNPGRPRQLEEMWWRSE